MNYEQEEMSEIPMEAIVMIWTREVRSISMALILIMLIKHDFNEWIFLDDLFTIIFFKILAIAASSGLKKSSTSKRN